ncbi:MAG TPA: TonB-dependent receptor, partial [Candidatus Binataceae bacterium]|nr:TonB-dependent receptor [Candidatus Binataceae bacterium]
MRNALSKLASLREGFAAATRHRAQRFSIALLVFCFLAPGTAAGAARGQAVAQPLAGTIKDALGRPLPKAAVTLQSSDRNITLKTSTDARGFFEFKEARAGIYALTARKKGYRQATRIIVLPKDASEPVEIALESEQVLTLSVSASRIRAQNGLSPSGANKYTLTSSDITSLPQGEATPLNEVMLQMPGVALDQNQEIHIRGEHMGIQYQMNGIMLPLDMNNDPTFTQLLNLRFVKSVSLIEGVMPAQYGYRTSGVIEINTRSGCEAGQNELTVSGGQRDTAETAFQLGGCARDFSYFVTGLFLQSNLGLSSAVPAPDPIHDAVTQGQGFAYLTYELNPTTKLSLISGMTLAFNQFPNQPNEAPQYQLDHIDPALHPSSGINSGLNQQDYYGVLALNGVLGSKADYQLAYSAHYSSQTFYPDPASDLIYQGISSNVFTSDLANTLQGDLTYRTGVSHTLRAGFYLG